jgi:hypothetical protein
MKTRNDALTKPSEPEKAEAYTANLRHPLTDVVAALRKIILSTSDEIGEEVKWNAPTFFYSGEMKPSDPKEFKRYIVDVQPVAERLHPPRFLERGSCE